MTNQEIAQEINNRIGTSPVPFDSVYSVALQIYQELGGDETQFDSVYSILLETLNVIDSGISAKVIDDSTVVLDKTWSSEKINEEIQAVAGTANSDIEEKSTIDFTFVESLPASGEEDQYVVINGENQDTLYKYVSGAWVEQTPDANALYFDTEGAALYSYVTADSQFAPIGLVDTIIVTGNLNSNAALKQIKTAGTYNVLQHLTSSTRGSYMKNWVLTVQAVDYDEYDSGDSVYQKMENNVTIYKRTWSGTRSSNDGWTVFSTYYEGLVKDTSTSKYYTWSSNKINSGLTLLDEKIENVKPIEEVSELPEASENKDKLFRLDNGEKDVYTAKLLSSETITTNRLPDDEQIDKAYLYQDAENIYYYKGAYTLHCDDGDLIWYRWGEINGDELVFATELSPNEGINNDTPIVCINDYGSNITETSAVFEGMPIDDVKSDGTIGNYGIFIIPATYNAPEANQIGNAYIRDDGGDYEYYTSEEIDVVVSDGSIKLYEWKYDDSYYIYTNKKASEIYGEIWWDEDEQQLHSFTDFLHISSINLTDGGFTKSGNTYTNLNKTVDEIGLMTSTYFNLCLYGLYIPQLNAPDSEQVGNAYIDEDYIGGRCLYTGVETTIEFDGSTLTVYEWISNGEVAYPVYSTKRANEIYNIDKDSDDVRFFIEDDAIYEITFADEYILSISTVKYQRSETTETWGWGEVINENIINDSSASTTSVYSSSKVNELLGAKQDVLTAGENIEIADNKINAIGYAAGKYNTSSFVELPEVVIEPYTDITSQLPSSDLYFTGDAGATTYTVSGQLTAMVGNMVGMVAFQVGSGNIALLTSYDSTNTTVTLDKTLDADNALSNTQVSKLYMVILAYLSGDAGATTYTYTDSTGGYFNIMLGNGGKLKIGSYELVTIVSNTTTTVTLDKTLDADNAVTNAQFMYQINTNNTASGAASHAEGHGTLAQNYGEHAEGQYNVSHAGTNEYSYEGNTQHSVGIGTGSSARKNAFEIMQNGDMYVYGVGGYQGTDTTVQDNTIQTLQAYIASLEARIAALEGN